MCRQWIRRSRYFLTRVIIWPRAEQPIEDQEIFYFLQTFALALYHTQPPIHW